MEVEINPQSKNAKNTLFQSILDLDVVRLVMVCLCNNLTAIYKNINPPVKGNRIYRKFKLGSNIPIRYAVSLAAILSISTSPVAILAISAAP